MVTYSSVVSRCSVFSLVIAASCALTACGPRGESLTLDEVFANARSEYASASTAGVPAEVGETLKKVSGELDRLAGINGAGDVRVVAKGVADTLDALVWKSGMTQRPSMTELVNQYRAIGNAKPGEVDLGAPQAKLLVARTYTLLKSELISTKFGL
jgi:hypothetical protein